VIRYAVDPLHMRDAERHMPAQVNKKALVKLLDRLATAAEYARVPARRRKSGFKSWGGKTSTVAFVRENVSVLEDVVTAFWSAKTEIQLTTDPTAIEKALIPALRTLHADSRPALPSDVDAVFAAVEAQPVEDYEVFQPIFGAAWDVRSALPLVFGPFTVYHRAAHRAHLESKYPSASPTELARDLDTFDSDLLVSTVVRARDHNAITDIAERRLHRFENLFIIMLSRLDDTYDFAAFDPKFRHSVQHMCLAAHLKHPLAGWRAVGPKLPVNVADSHWTNPQWGFDRLWEYAREDTVTTRPLTEDLLRERILNAVDWTAKGLRDELSDRQFVQFMFAMEALLSSRNHDVPLTSRLAEFAAHIIGGGREKRITHDKNVRYLYGVRSDIAHGRVQEVSPRDRALAHDIVNSIVVRLLTHRELSQMRTMGELERWIEQRRYS
jgi:hypothetical protein